MKILIIQLARLGDILSTVPTANGLRRKFPDAEIHLLVRSRFKFAASAVAEVNAVWTLDSRRVLEPLLIQEKNVSAATNQLQYLTSQLKDLGFDKIINLSFSPLSSFLCYTLDPGKRYTVGYTRHRDGFLDPNEDASSYFFAQVGIGKYNRLHVADLFAQVAGVELESNDWRLPESIEVFPGLPNEYIVVHVGASLENKSYPAAKWYEVINGISAVPIVLIGTKSEEKIVEEILKNATRRSQIINLVGKTRFDDLFYIIKNSQLLIGADSAPVHVASLCGTRCLNLSCSEVNFWETGPRSLGSRILLANKISEVEVSKIIGEVKNILADATCSDDVIETINSSPSFECKSKLPGDFQWQLISGLYLGTDLPRIDDYDAVLALAQLRELNTIITQQTHLILERSDKKIHSDLITRADVIISGIKRMCPSLSPLIEWYEVQKTRIPPGEVREIAKKTLKICKGLEHVLSLYLGAPQTLTGRSHEKFELESIPDFE